MFKKNAETGALNKYFDISSYLNKSGKIRWIAWFYQRVEDAAKDL